MSTRYNTGNPIESTDVRDMSDNAKNFDEFSNSGAETFTDRLGAKRKTIHGMNSQFDSQILNIGFTRVGTFAAGETLTNPRQTLLWDIADGGDGQEYGWSGVFPKVVPEASTPASTGGISVGAWISRFDPELRIQVRESLRRSYAEAGYSLVDGSFEAGGTLTGVGDVLLHEARGKAYSWRGSYPPGVYIVPPSSSPSEASWVDVSPLEPGAGTVRDGRFALRDFVSVQDFGAVGDGVVDDTAALTSLAAWVNSRPKYSNPVTVHFPNGTYLYSGGLDFIRPVAIYGLQGATLKYTGSGKALAVGDPTPENAPTADNFYQGEYTVDGLRFTGGESATHGIFIKSFVFTPRIRNCLFVDFGNSASCDIYAQYEDWDGLIECCEKHTYFSTVATGNFIALVSKRTDGSAYDGGNSRFTIRDCSIGAYDNQELGYFAYINSVKCRVIGGNAHHSTGGILIGPNAHGTIVDGYYTEVSTTYRPWMISVLSDTSNPANYLIPQGVLIKNCYVNMHSEKIGNNGRIIGMMDAGVKLRNWVVEDIAVSTFQNGQVLIDMNNLNEQIGNVYNRITPIFVPYNSSGGAKFTVVNNPPSSPNAWTSGDVEEGVWTPNVGGTATYSIQKGKFRREGRKVTVQFDLHINTIGTGNQSAILGLPYTVGSETGSGSVGYYVNLALNVYTLNIRAEALNANLLISGSTAPASGVSSYIAALGNNARIIGNCTYFI